MIIVKVIYIENAIANNSISVLHAEVLFWRAHKSTIYSGSDRLNNQLDIWAAAGKSYLDEQLKRSGG